MPRLAARVDRNQPEIVDALRKAGYSVLHLHRLGHGVPDLLVGWGDDFSILVEIKSEEGELTPDEERFISEWRGPIVVVHSVGEALDAIQKNAVR
ncbi:MAG: hypothetical protein V1791_04570 [Pseudomonadota bacterium]